MRELLIRQTASEALEAAQVAAIAGIGLRGDTAREAMRAARVRFSRRKADERWRAIVRGAWKTRLDASETESQSTETKSQ